MIDIFPDKNYNRSMTGTEFDSNYTFLVEAAKSSGATEAVLINAADIVIEERIQLKCKTGCPSYGQRFSCPPFTPPISEFKIMIPEYENALLIRFPSAVVTEPEIIHSLLKNKNDSSVSRDIKNRAGNGTNSVSGRQSFSSCIHCR
jgi:predicted metal-binding protein